MENIQTVNMYKNRCMLLVQSYNYLRIDMIMGIDTVNSKIHFVSKHQNLVIKLPPPRPELFPKYSLESYLLTLRVLLQCLVRVSKFISTVYICFMEMICRCSNQQCLYY